MIESNQGAHNPGAHNPGAHALVLLIILNSQVPPMVKHLKQVGALGGGAVLVSETFNFQKERIETQNEGIAPMLLHRRGKLFDPATFAKANADQVPHRGAVESGCI
jgi:hypothetical protein